MAKKKCKIIDFSKAGSYKGKKWKELEKREKECKGKVEKFIPSSGEVTEVKRRRLIQDGRPVCKNGRSHEFEFNDKRGGFAMTKTYYLGMKETLKKFKVPKCKI